MNKSGTEELLQQKAVFNKEDFLAMMGVVYQETVTRLYKRGQINLDDIPQRGLMYFDLEGGSLIINDCLDSQVISNIEYTMSDVLSIYSLNGLMEEALKRNLRMKEFKSNHMPMGNYQFVDISIGDIVNSNCGFDGGHLLGDVTMELVIGKGPQGSYKNREVIISAESPRVITEEDMHKAGLIQYAFESPPSETEFQSTKLWEPLMLLAFDKLKKNVGLEVQYDHR